MAVQRGHDAVLYVTIQWEGDTVNEKCFAKRKSPSRSGNCICLVGNCPGYDRCPFYKPVWKYENDVGQRYARLASLSVGQQNYIANTYYRGLMPWRRDMV